MPNGVRSDRSFRSSAAAKCCCIGPFWRCRRLCPIFVGEAIMPRIVLVQVLVLASFLLAQPASAKSSVGVVHNFGPDLSSQCNLPEGIAADPSGHIYASSLNFNATTG